MVRILTNETPVEELKRKFSDEVRDMMKAAALELNCNVEELKYRVNNAGIVEIELMTPDELIELTGQETRQKKQIAIKKSRGVFDG